MIDVFTKVVLAGVCLFTFAWVILAQRRTIKRLSDVYLRLTHFQRVLVALAVVICTVYAQKPSTNNVEGATGTNEVETVGGGGQRSSHAFLLKKRELDAAWNLVKVTRRGVAEIGEVVLVEGRKPGAALIVR